MLSAYGVRAHCLPTREPDPLATVTQRARGLDIRRPFCYHKFASLPPRPGYPTATHLGLVPPAEPNPQFAGGTFVETAGLMPDSGRFGDQSPEHSFFFSSIYLELSGLIRIMNSTTSWD